jgi:hypothetical protein
MSLKHLADELAARGRYGDTELVHMSKGEVAGLQQLAQSAGGSLTINPDTGKPEAFFLAALLPTLLGAAAPALGAAAEWQVRCHGLGRFGWWPDEQAEPTDGRYYRRLGRYGWW